MAGLENKQARNILLGASTQSGLFLPSHPLRGCGVLVADLDARELRQHPFWLSSAEAAAEAIYLEAERQRRQSLRDRTLCADGVLVADLEAREMDYCEMNCGICSLNGVARARALAEPFPEMSPSESSVFASPDRLSAR